MCMKKGAGGQVREDLSLLGSNISRRRSAKGLSQEDLSNMLKVHPVTISDWETGQHEPKSFALFRLAVALSCSMEDLLVGVVDTDNLGEIQGSDHSDLKTLQHRFCDLIQTIGKLNRQCDTPEEVMRLLLDVGDNGEINHPENEAFLDLLEILAPLAGEILRSIRRGERIAS